jgi:hypothetical protein
MVNILLDCGWDNPSNLLRRYTRFTPGNTGEWGRIRGVDNVEEADFIVCIGPETSRDYKGKKVIQLRREPDFIESFRKHPAAVAILDYTGSGYHAGTYHLSSSYDHLINLEYPEKKKKCSLISSSKWPYRNKLVSMISKSTASRSIDFFGKSLDKIIGKDLHMGELDFPNSNCKEDALFDYTYSIAIENSKQDCYFSEKLIDCFLTWTMPIYWGCPNLDDYFPSEAFIAFDEHDISSLNDIIEAPLSDIQIEAIRHSRESVLNKYGLWPTIDSIVEKLR